VKKHDMDRIALARSIYTTSRIQGEFLLRSGVVSNEYFDKYLFEAQPQLLQEIATAMSDLVPDACDALAGLEMGGIPVATVLSQLTGLPTLFVRKEAKEYGTRKLAEGGSIEGRRLVIVEDVVTSGGAILDATGKLRALGAEVTDVVCVIDREAGGRDNLLVEGLALHSLFTMSELKQAVET
jgi:orotate phosphoribosyltransferase